MIELKIIVEEMCDGISINTEANTKESTKAEIAAANIFVSCIEAVKDDLKQYMLDRAAELGEDIKIVERKL